MTPTDPQPPALDAAYWLAFSLDHNTADAAARFTQRTGTEPFWLLEQAGLLWVGPLPKARAVATGI